MHDDISVDVEGFLERFSLRSSQSVAQLLG